MARPEKEGLEYFPLDTDIDQDDKVRLIEAEHGVVGFGILIKLLMKIYKEGYFYEWGEPQQLLFSSGANVDINKVVAVVNSCLKWGLFHKELYEKHGILTSKGIQRRFAKATTRRKAVKANAEYWLLTSEKWPHVVIVDISGINACNNPPSATVNGDISTQSKVKESKVNKSTRTPPILPPVMTGNSGNGNDALKNIYNAFSNNIHPITPFEADGLAEWLDDGMEPELIIWAIRQAVLHGKRTTKYIDAILRNLHTENITTLAGAEARERNREQGKRQQLGAGRAREPTRPRLSPEEKERIADLNRQLSELAEGKDLNRALEVPP